MLRNLAIPVGLIALGAVGTAFAGVQQPPPGPGLDLINERCGFCHAPAQVTSVRKTPAEWAATVQSMIDRGAELEPEEQQVMVAYLSANLATGGAPAPAGGTPAAAAPTPTAPGHH